MKSQSQTHTFIAEFELGKQYFSGNDKTSYNIFLKNYYVRVYKAIGENYGEEIKNVKLLPKEDWYPQFNGETRKVELIIEIPDTLLYTYRKKVDDIGGINIFCQLWSAKSQKLKASIKKPIPITWNQLNKTSYNYINKTTFKLGEPIVITSPAEVGLKLSLEFLKISLDSITDDIPQFKYTVMDLDSLLKKSRESIKLSYFQFTNLSKLLIFLESYVPENSFINKEARELYQNIQSIKDSLDRFKNSNDVNKYQRDSLLEQISNQLEIFSDYQVTINRIRNYYSELQLVLYGRLYNSKTQNVDSIYKTNSESRKLNFALGSSVSMGFRPLYNVTLSAGDTVQFESVSRINTTLSAGVFWSPQPASKKALNKDSNNDTLKRSALFSIGLMLNYTIIPNSSQLPGSNPLGIGLALGYKTQNFGFYFMGALKLVRQPRQYFIDQYKNTNLTLNSLDINDGKIFINKTNLTVGISVMYFINAKK